MSINALVAGAAPTHVLILNPAAGPFRQIDEHPRTIAPAQLWRTHDLDPNGLAA